MSGCGKATVITSPIDIKWFYKIQEKGLCIQRKDLYKIIEDPTMPKDVKKQIKKVFQYL
jgi:ABC-type dipeptide/oligopeptide/nickel transport system ATPase component